MITFCTSAIETLLLLSISTQDSTAFNPKNMLIALCTSAMVTVPLASQSPGLVGADLVAKQLAVDPPFAPSHVQLHGPVPVIVVAVPDKHKLIVGTIVKDWLLEVPHTPRMGAGITLIVTVFAAGVL